MRPNKSRKPFTLYQKETQAGLVWYARFWDETTRRYAVTRSTGIPVEGKKQRRYETEQAAREMLPHIQFIPVAPEKYFIQYVSEFWLTDSVYAKEHSLVEKQPLSVDYVTMNHENVRRHMEPFSGFENITLQSLTAGVIRDWVTWAMANGRTGRSVNTTLQAMRIAVRYAVAREGLSKDPFRNIKNVTENHREKGILSPSEVSRLIQPPANDPYNRLAVLLGIFCGLRRGEARGLQWGDIENGIINIRHNFLENEGLKTPKCGSILMVPVPQSVQLVFEIIRNLSGRPQPNNFVLHNPVKPGKPFSPKYFQRALANELRAIGIQEDEQKRRNLTFHGLRHTFVTLGRLAGITDFEIQALVGHKSGAMMEHYSHAGQVLDFTSTRKKLERSVEEKGA
jgi:integrase